MDFMNQWVTPGNVLWLAAAVSLLLLVFSRPVFAIWTSGSSGGAMRAYRTVLYVAVFFLVFFPCLILVVGETVDGLPCGLYVLFFSLFCYYLGKNIGVEQGRRAITDLMGLGTGSSIEEAQDRLFESHMRLPGRSQVAESISAHSAAARRKNGPAGSGPNGLRNDGIENAEILDVAVEELDELE